MCNVAVVLSVAGADRLRPRVSAGVLCAVATGVSSALLLPFVEISGPRGLPRSWDDYKYMYGYVCT